jgi:hypothetical protein
MAQDFRETVRWNRHRRRNNLLSIIFDTVLRGDRITGYVNNLEFNLEKVVCGELFPVANNRGLSMFQSAGEFDQCRFYRPQSSKQPPKLGLGSAS